MLFSKMYLGDSAIWKEDSLELNEGVPNIHIPAIVAIPAHPNPIPIFCFKDKPFLFSVLVTLVLCETCSIAVEGLQAHALPKKP